MIKGLACGTSTTIIGILLNDQNVSITTVLLSLILGFFAYGLSILFYIKAQRHLGAAKTSAFYTVNPFIGAILSLAILGEPLNVKFIISFIIMTIGIVFIIIDSLKQTNTNQNCHLI